LVGVFENIVHTRTSVLTNVSSSTAVIVIIGTSGSPLTSGSSVSRGTSTSIIDTGVTVCIVIVIIEVINTDTVIHTRVEGTRVLSSRAEIELTVGTVHTIGANTDG